MNGLGKYSTIALQLLVSRKGLLQTSGGECKMNISVFLQPDGVAWVQTWRRWTVGGNKIWDFAQVRKINWGKGNALEGLAGSRIMLPPKDTHLLIAGTSEYVR